MNDAVKRRKVIRASKFTVVSFDAVRGDCLRNKDGTQGTCVDPGTLLRCIARSYESYEQALLWGGTLPFFLS